MRYKSKTDVHIFDCDGVIIDSNELKIEALTKSLEYIQFSTKAISWAAESFRTNFGRTRAKHFDEFFRYANDHGHSLTERDKRLALTQYSKHVLALLGHCELIPETLEYINQISTSSEIYVVSASDQSELRLSLPLKHKRLVPEKIYGGPELKIFNIKKVIDETSAGSVVYYGDSIQDAKAAMKCGVEFCGLTKYSADKSALYDFCKSERLSCYSHCGEVFNK